MQIADVGQDVWVGNFEACDARLAEFARSIHIHHPYHAPKWVCRSILSGQCPGLVVCYSDGDDLLLKCVPPLGALAAYARQPGKLLIHCAMGCYRGPTLAVLAKVARGSDFFDALRDVARGMWTQYGSPQIPYLNSIPLRQILDWRAEG